jgi:hypothetical protein
MGLQLVDGQLDPGVGVVGHGQLGSGDLAGVEDHGEQPIGAGMLTTLVVVLSIIGPS